MTDGRAAATDPTYSTGLLASGLMLPAVPLAIGIVALLANIPLVGAVGIGIGVVVAWLFAASYLRIDDGVLTVRMLSPRRRSIRLADVEKAYLEPAAPSLWQVPGIRLEGRDGERAMVCLGWWRHESLFLGRLDDELAAAGVRAGADLRAILRRRPSGWFWSLGSRRRSRVPRSRPFRRGPLDQAVFVIGLASMALGALVVILAIDAHAGLGSYRLVPAVVVGYQAVLLGGLAILFARPARERRRLAGPAWFWLAMGLVSTFATVVIALDAYGIEIAPSRGLLRAMVGLAAWVGVIGFGITILWGGASVIQGLWRRFLRARGSEWLG